MKSTGSPLQDPLALFQQWLTDARALPPSVLPEPTAFALATVSSDGQPSVRTLLLKDVDERGFVFYTNLDSRKGRELAANARAAMNFHWAPLERQVRIEGRVSRVSDDEADAYFATRPRGSQLGAWASQQSRRLESAAGLEARVAEFDRKFEGQRVPRPSFWSGFRLHPATIEFWTGRPNRLHERQLFERRDGEWIMQLLYP